MSVLGVVPIAGFSERFQKAGYALPKAMLPIGDRTVLDHVINRVPTDEILVVGRADDLVSQTYIGGIFSRCKKHCTATWLGKDTADPFDTIFSVRSLLVCCDEVVINYCDTFLINDYDCFLRACHGSTADAGMVTFKSNDQRFGRSRGGDAIGGIFYFASGTELYKRLVDLNSKRSNAVMGMPDVVMSYPDFYEYPAKKNIVDIGTPDAYKEFLKELSQI